MLIASTIFFIIIFLVFLVILDLRLGKFYNRKNNIQIPYPIRTGNVQLFTDGPSLFKTMFRDIERAENHIHILFYIFRTDAFGNELIHLLEKRAAEGVKVRVLLDRIGSLKFPRKEAERLRSKGIELAFCHRVSFPFLIYKSQRRNHRKITVIDGKVGYLGGFNVGKEYVNQDEVLNPWRDCHSRFTGEGVKDLQQQFLRDWKDATKEIIRKTDELFPPLEKGDVTLQFHSFEGEQLEEAFVRLIKNAKKEIIIGTPYFIPGKFAFQKLMEAIHRGVQLTLIVPAKGDHPLIKEASYRYLRVLEPLGCKIYQYEEGFYHAKILIIDDELCSVGTANFDKRSFNWNDEMNCFIYDEKIVAKMREISGTDISKSSLLSLQEINKPDLARTLKEWLAFLINPLL